MIDKYKAELDRLRERQNDYRGDLDHFRSQIRINEAEAKDCLQAIQRIGHLILSTEREINQAEAEADDYPYDQFVVDSVEGTVPDEPISSMNLRHTELYEDATRELKNSQGISESELRLAEAKLQIAAFGRTTPKDWIPTIRSESSHKEKGGD